MAATTEVGICNLALGWLGANRIVSFDDEMTEAELCKANYNTLRRAELENLEWTFAQARIVLAPLAAAPAWGYGTAFEKPGACLKVNYLGQSGDPSENDAFEDWVAEGNQLLVQGVAAVAYLRYTVDIADVAKFPDSFAHTLAAHLAMDIATPLTHNSGLQGAMAKLYGAKLAAAAQMDQKQGRSRVLRAPGMLNARRSGSSIVGPIV